MDGFSFLNFTQAMQAEKEIIASGSELFSKTFGAWMRFWSVCETCRKGFFPIGRATVCSEECEHPGVNQKKVDIYILKCLYVAKYYAKQISFKYPLYDYDSAFSDASICIHRGLQFWFSERCKNGNKKPILESGRMDSLCFTLLKRRIVRRFQIELKRRLALKRNSETCELLENDQLVECFQIEKNNKNERHKNSRNERIRFMLCRVHGCERALQTRTMCAFHRDKSAASVKRYNEKIFKNTGQNGV